MSTLSARLLALLGGTSAADLEEVDGAIADLERHHSFLCAARDLLRAGVPVPAAGPEPFISLNSACERANEAESYSHHQTSRSRNGPAPAPAPANPRRKCTAGETERRRMEALILISKEGPQTGVQVARALAISSSSAYGLLSHPWFEPEPDGYHLSALGRTALNKPDEGE